MKEPRDLKDLTIHDVQPITKKLWSVVPGLIGLRVEGSRKSAVFGVKENPGSRVQGVQGCLAHEKLLLP